MTVILIVSYKDLRRNEITYRVRKNHFIESLRIGWVRFNKQVEKTFNESDAIGNFTLSKLGHVFDEVMTLTFDEKNKSDFRRCAIRRSDPQLKLQHSFFSISIINP